LKDIPSGVAEALHDEGYLDLQETFTDGSFAPAKKGGLCVGKRNAARDEDHGDRQTRTSGDEVASTRILKFVSRAEHLACRERWKNGRWGKLSWTPEERSAILRQDEVHRQADERWQLNHGPVPRELSCSVLARLVRITVKCEQRISARRLAVGGAGYGFMAGVGASTTTTYASLQVWCN
jgi:hypothetical protein